VNIWTNYLNDKDYTPDIWQLANRYSKLSFQKTYRLQSIISSNWIHFHGLVRGPIANIQLFSTVHAPFRFINLTFKKTLGSVPFKIPFVTLEHNKYHGFLILLFWNVISKYQQHHPSSLLEMRWNTTQLKKKRDHNRPVYAALRIDICPKNSWFPLWSCDRLGWDS